MEIRTTPNRSTGLFALIFLAILVLSLSVPTAAFADPTAADKEAEAQAALASLTTMRENLDIATNSYHQAVAEQEAAQERMAEAQIRIEEATTQISDLQDRLGTRASIMYRNGEFTFLDLFFGATSFEEFVTNWDILMQLNQSDADLVRQVKELRAEVEQEQKIYAEQEQIAAEKAASAKASLEEAEATTAAMQATYESLSAEAAALLAAEQAAQQAAALAHAQQNIQDAPGSSPDEGITWSGGGTPDGSILGNAYSRLGAPYVAGGKGPNSFDCSGFVAWCYGGSVPSYTGGLIGLPRVSNPQPGDIAVIHSGSNQHCGIYIGGGQMIHAATEGVGVVEGPVQSGMVFVRP